MSYTGHPYVDIRPHNSSFDVTFYENGNIDFEPTTKSKVAGKRFATKEEADKWSKIIISLARKKSSEFHKLSWGEQRTILQNIVENVTKEELESHWEESMASQTQE